MGTQTQDKPATEKLPKSEDLPSLTQTAFHLEKKSLDSAGGTSEDATKPS